MAGLVRGLDFVNNNARSAADVRLQNDPRFRIDFLCFLSFFTLVSKLH